MFVLRVKVQEPRHTEAIFYTYIALKGGICGQRKETGLEFRMKGTYARYEMARED